MAASSNVPLDLLNEYGVAKIVGLSVATIRRWRLLGQGPKYIKLNSSVRYRPEDLVHWLNSRPSGAGYVEAR
jgi:predicted DNA-binding transcriptional regulator AlpA